MAGVYTVSQVNAYIKNMFVQDYALNRISIKGEVSNVKYHTSGHIYFTLKDGKGALSAVMFASQRMGLSFPLKEGQQVVATGSVDVYERDGRYQLYAREIRLDGMGALYLEFVRLRNELQEMGMFADEYKQPVPHYAQRVGVVTAPTGAAIRDIMNISSRRNPYVQLILYPALVQGKDAAASIVRGIETLDAMGLDVLIVGRGGGSIEDLWAFNEESVARAIFECSTPVISAAAELAVFDYRQFAADLSIMRESLVQAQKRRLDWEKSRLEQYRLRLKVQDPARKLNDRRMRIMKLEEDLQEAIQRKLLARKHQLEILAGRLQGASPLEKISGGYGFLTDEKGRRIVRVSQVKPGDVLDIRVRDGKVRARAEDVEVL